MDATASLLAAQLQTTSSSKDGSVPHTHSKARLFLPIRVGTMQLQNRVVLAPLTRFRADKAHVPTDLQVEYYAQRASVPGTLLVTEATFISPNAGGYDYVPGIWNDAQVEGWKKVTNAVHARKSFIYLQLWAIGRAAEPNLLFTEDEESNPGGPYPFVSSSSIPLSTRPSEDPTPRALTGAEISEYLVQYATGAKNAIRAGFDGVEVHGAHGYLVDQFIQSNSNKRTDQWGGSVEGRAKFALAVVDSVVAAVGAERTGIRLSPWSGFQDMRMPNIEDIHETFSYLVRSIRDAHPNFAYLHCPEPRVAGIVDREQQVGESNDFLADIWLREGGRNHNRVYIAAGGFTAQSALEATEKKDKVLVAFGRYFISTPDLPGRVEKNITLTRYNRDTFYTPQKPEGYTDYGFEDREAEANHRLRSQQL